MQKVINASGRLFVPADGTSRSPRSQLLEPFFVPCLIDTRKPEAQATPGLPASAPPGTRTPNLLIKSQLLCQLS